MVWAKHRLQILREAESIVNPQEPWPYTQIIVEAPEALGHVADAHAEMLRVEEDGDGEVEHLDPEILCVRDGLDGEDGAASLTDPATSLAPHHIDSPHSRERAAASGAGASGAPKATAAIGSSKWRKGNAGKGKGTGGGLSWSNPTGGSLSSVGRISDGRSRFQLPRFPSLVNFSWHDFSVF
jgi:hypothetical protein